MRHEKISAEQRRILKTLWEEGTFLHSMTGLHPRYFFHNSMKNARFNSVQKLIREGLLEVGKHDWRGGQWFLTEAGKQEAMKP